MQLMRVLLKLTFPTSVGVDTTLAVSPNTKCRGRANDTNTVTMVTLTDFLTVNFALAIMGDTVNSVRSIVIHTSSQTDSIAIARLNHDTTLQRKTELASILKPKASSTNCGSRPVQSAVVSDAAKQSMYVVDEYFLILGRDRIIIFKMFPIVPTIISMIGTVLQSHKLR